MSASKSSVESVGLFDFYNMKGGIVAILILQNKLAPAKLKGRTEVLLARAK